MMASSRATVGVILTSPSPPMLSRLSIIWRKWSVAAKITSIISVVTVMSPLRSSSMTFSARWASILIWLSPKKPEAPFNECMGRKISFSKVRLSGAFSSSSKFGSMVSKCSFASTIKSAINSGSKKSWLIMIYP